MRVRLSDLGPGEAAVIEDIALPEAEQQLLIRFGFFDGAEVRCSRRAPLGDPIVYSLDGSEIALRSETACRIFAWRGDGQTHEKS
jgi:Fe2+ transport system protein FeoA